MSRDPRDTADRDPADRATADDQTDVTRRQFLEVAGAAVVVAAAVPAAAAQERRNAGSPVRPRTAIRLTVNGNAQRIEVDDHWTLAELLRDHLRLTGTKLGCERGECGACTVLLDDMPIYACSYLAVWADGRSVLTVEGLARGTTLDPLQEAFIAHDAPQCGFCTSGQLMSAKGLLKHNPAPTREEVRAALSGNICRCSNYSRIVEAVLAASAGGRAGRPSGGAA